MVGLENSSGTQMKLFAGESFSDEALWLSSRDLFVLAGIFYEECKFLNRNLRIFALLFHKDCSAPQSSCKCHLIEHFTGCVFL